jgi:hypothetical protein
MLEKAAADALRQMMGMLEGFQKEAAKIAPDAIEAVGRAIFWQNVIPLVGSMVVFVALAWFFKRSVRVAKAACWEYGPEGDGVCCLIYWVALLASTIAVLTNWLDATRWMGVFDQKAYIAHLIMQKLLNPGQ